MKDSITIQRHIPFTCLFFKVKLLYPMNNLPSTTNSSGTKKLNMPISFRAYNFGVSLSFKDMWNLLPQSSHLINPFFISLFLGDRIKKQAQGIIQGE